MNADLRQMVPLLTISDDSFDNSITFMGGDLDLEGTEIRINTDRTLTFNKGSNITCKLIVIKNCSVTIQGLSLTGTISVISGKLTLIDCNIQHPVKSRDYLVSVLKFSNLTTRRCLFHNTKKFGICADECSQIHMDHCEIYDTSLYSIALTGISFLDANNCKFYNSKSDIIYADGESRVVLTKCIMKDSIKRGLYICNSTTAKIHLCTLNNCKMGAVYSSFCERVYITDCKISDCPQTAVYFENSTAVVKHTIIFNCDGNAINSSNKSKLILSKCSLRGTNYPPLAICENSIAYVKKSSFSDTPACGIIVRNDSKAAIECCTIEKAQLFGFCVSDSKEVSLCRCLISNCGQNSIGVYNHSRVHLHSCFLVGPTKVGINIFTGGYVCAGDTTIAGMTEHGIWLHHGGSGRFLTTLIQSEPFNQTEDVAEQIRAIQLTAQNEEPGDTDKIIKIETKRTVISSKILVVGHGLIDIIHNENNEASGPGIEAAHPTCKICGVDCFECHFSPCGHCLYCKDCWNSLVDKPTVCELCLMPIEKIIKPLDCSSDESQGICSICMDSVADTVIVPCGHTICCECAKHWFLSSSDCPFCREPFSKYRQYVAYE